MTLNEHNQDNLKRDIQIFAPLSKKQETYLNDKEHDIVVWGGAAASGKSYLSSLDILVNGWEDKDYRATIVRRKREQFKQAGGLYDECCSMYSNFGVKPRGNTLDFRFPKGAFVKMQHSDRPSDKFEFNGNQSTTFLVDEAQQLNEANVVYLLSRNRSKSKQKHQLKLVCNPMYDSFLRIWLEKAGYLDKVTGIPLPEKDGVTTFYCEIAGETVFKNSRKEFEDSYPNMTIDEDYTPLKFVFYSANVHDNPYVCKHLKSYVSKLKNLPKIEKDMLYHGSWYAREEASGNFKKEWCSMVSDSEIPSDLRIVRAWDKASSLPSSAYPDPDWTVGIKGGIDNEGNIWVMDMKRFRNRPAIVQRTIEETGLKDGKNVIVGIPQDVGGAGKDAMETSRGSLMRRGLNVMVNRANKSKAIRFESVSIAAQNGQIKIVRGDWNKDFFEELETLDFNTRGGHDDIADAFSDLVIMLTARLTSSQIRIGSSNRTMVRGTLLK